MIIICSQIQESTLYDRHLIAQWVTLGAAFLFVCLFQKECAYIWDVFSYYYTKLKDRNCHLLGSDQGFCQIYHLYARFHPQQGCIQLKIPLE